jgi:type II secretory pathway component PulM
MVRIGGLALVATLVWLLAIEPLQKALDAATARRDAMVASVERMQAIAERVERLGGVPTATADDPVDQVGAILRTQIGDGQRVLIDRPAADRLAVDLEFETPRQMVDVMQALESAGYAIDRVQLSSSSPGSVGAGLSARIGLLTP